MNSYSEQFFIEELSQASKTVKVACKGLSIGSLIKSIRSQLGMSQSTVAKRAGIPQSTVSRVEQGKKDVSLSTLGKVLHALSCDLVIAPLMHDSISAIRRRQARKIAEKEVRYVTGTMNLENQQPDSLFMKNLLKQEEERLLHEPKAKLWDEL